MADVKSAIFSLKILHFQPRRVEIIYFFIFAHWQNDHVIGVRSFIQIKNLKAPFIEFGLDAFKDFVKVAVSGFTDIGDFILLGYFDKKTP